MKRTFNALSLVMIFALMATALGVTSPVHALPTIYYAAPGGLTSGSCDSWANACALSYAQNVAQLSDDEIWVAAGTHKPGTLRTDTFQLKNGVAVYGGFAGTETSRDQRDPALNITILSGDIDNNDSQTPIITDINTVTGNDTNSYSVVKGVTGGTLDGFTITAGYNNGDGDCSFGCGAGVRNLNSSPVLKNISFRGNWSLSGAAMSNQSSSPILTNVTFSGNKSAWHAGAIYNFSGSPILTNVTFVNNSTPGYGGGIFNNSSSNATLINVTFNGNSAGQGGGVANSGSNPDIRNSIFWGNTASSGQQIYNGGSTPTVSDSVVQGGYAGGTNIITTDPLLGTLGNYGGATQTIPLLPGSSAIDAGDDVTCAATDQRGVARPQGAHCDIGAYEVGIYTVTFDGNGGGTPAPTSISVTYGSAYGTLATVSRAGYTFNGWYDAATGGTLVTAATVVTTASDHTLYAQWTANTYTVTFDGNGGGTPAPTSMSVTYGSTYGTLATVSRAGYAFNGWYNAATGGNLVTAATIVATTADHTLYAQWTANTYTVTFDGNGGTPAPASMSVTYASTYGTLATVSRAGYTFNGWYTASTGGTLVTAATVVTTASDHSLYAQWTANTYTVTFDGNGGGTPSPASKSVTFGSPYGTLATVSRAGYTFNGWYTASTGGTLVTAATVVTTASDHSLYAQWTALTGPDKIAPADTAVDVSLNPTLSWNQLVGATSYEYCYSSAPGPCTKWNPVGSDTSVTLNGLAPNYTYYWQVRAVNAGGSTEADGGTWWSFTTTTALACTWPPYTAPTTPTFGDVPMDAGHWSWVERLANSTITAGCGGGNYCPFSDVVRAQMAIFLLRGKHCGSSYVPPAVGATTGFADVPLDATYAPWVKQLAAEGVTAGCGNGNFCPQTVVNRAQMAIFLLRAKHGSTYSPPAVGATTGFADVPLDATYAAWVKQLAAESITAGCGGGNFCPLQNVNRAQMATFLVRAFGLP